ncbi:hypothetical protein KIW84_043600 [Lathyrus oleraceus]|uniref:Uncharacterized protein n=1 Tax=Pisum sativum TaxID=3888 RepID=A0A9D4XFM0_PEA|nr:hypothetical protein KIW84_043600 [Pisum sativum]
MQRFEFSPNSASHSLQLGPESESNETRADVESHLHPSKYDNNGSHFQRLQYQVTKLFKGFSSPPDVENENKTYNPEILTSLKRQWAVNFQLKYMGHRSFKKPSQLSESIVVVGLHLNCDDQTLHRQLVGRKLEESAKLRSALGCQNQSPVEPNIEPQHQVAVQSSAVANEPSLAVDGGTYDCVASEVVGTKTTHSAAIACEDLSAAASGTLSAASESLPSVSLEEKTICSRQVSACVSVGGPVTQVVSLNNHNSAKVDELSQEDKQLRQTVSTLQGCKNVSDVGTEFNQLKQGVSVTELNTEDVTLETGQQGQGGSASYITECDRMADNLNTGSVSLPGAPSTMDRPSLEPSKVKASSKGKKKRKEVLLKADAAGMTFDLYNTYKRPEEKEEAVVSSENTGCVSSGNLKQLPVDASQPNVVANEQCRQSKAETEDNLGITESDVTAWI